jgi:hypothetical protein
MSWILTRYHLISLVLLGLLLGVAMADGMNSHGMQQLGRSSNSTCAS